MNGIAKRYLSTVYHYGMGRHFYSLDQETQVKFEKVSSLDIISLVRSLRR